MCTYIGTTDFVNYANYSGCNVIQSMGYDHNTDTMYWYAHSQTAAGNTYINVCMTYKVDLATGKWHRGRHLGPGGQSPCSFRPTRRPICSPSAWIRKSASSFPRISLP